MSDPARGSYVRTLMRSGTSIAVAIGVMNVATYGFTIVAARILGPAEYGAFAGADGDAAGDRRAAARACRRPRPAGSRPSPSTSRRSSSRSCGVTYRGALVLGRGAGAGRAARPARCCGSTASPTAVLVGVCVRAADRSWAARPASSRASAAGGRSAVVYLAAGVPRLVARHRASSLVAARRVQRDGRRRDRRCRAGRGRLDRAARRAPPRGIAAGHDARVASSGSRSTTPRRCWRSSRSPTPTSSSPATCSPTTRPASTPAA